MSADNQPNNRGIVMTRREFLRNLVTYVAVGVASGGGGVVVSRLIEGRESDDDKTLRLLEDAKKLLREDDLSEIEFVMRKNILNEEGTVLSSVDLLSNGSKGIGTRVYFDLKGEGINPENLSRAFFLNSSDKVTSNPDFYFNFAVVGRDGKSRVSSIDIHDSHSDKSIIFSWRPDSLENLLYVDKGYFINPVDGEEYPWYVQIVTKTNTIPDDIQIGGTLLTGDDSKNRREPLLKLANAWREFTESDQTGNGSRLAEIQDFVSKTTPVVSSILKAEPNSGGS